MNGAQRNLNQRIGQTDQRGITDGADIDTGRSANQACNVPPDNDNSGRPDENPSNSVTSMRLFHQAGMPVRSNSGSCMTEF
jgi:hypothetical protein